MKRLRVVVFHVYPIVRAGMCAMLAAPDVSIVGEAPTKDALLRLLREMAPQVMLMSSLPLAVDECVELISAAKTQSPTTAVIMITASEHTSFLSRALRAGCSGYLDPRLTRSELLKALRLIARGECVVDPEHLKRLLGAIAEEPSPGKMESRRKLTLGEQNVLRLIVEGQSNRKIASNLGYSVATVKAYVRRIIQKLGVSDRTQAAVKAIRSGLIT